MVISLLLALACDRTPEPPTTEERADELVVLLTSDFEAALLELEAEPDRAAVGLATLTFLREHARSVSRSDGERLCAATDDATPGRACEIYFERPHLR